MQSGGSGSGGDEVSGSSKWAVIAILVLLFLVPQALSAFTVPMHGDETALLARAVDFLNSGKLQGGGRPGLAEFVLAPFAEGCRDVISALRQARLLWTGFTLAILLGLYQLTRRTLLASRMPRVDACLGIVMLAGLPAFLTTSVEVRTDQPALALALWGSVALVASRKRAGWALAAGGLVAAGFLFSQKAVYVAALGGLLALVELWLSEDPSSRRWRPLATRVLLAVTGVALTAALYRLVLPLFVELPKLMTLAGGLNVFAYYRKAIGYRLYLQLLPTMFPYLIVGLLAGWAAVTGAGTSAARRSLAAAVAVLALGLAVGLFHAGAFAYFWMTLGLFPAVATALSAEAIRESLPSPRARLVAGALVFGILLLQGSATAGKRLEDRQAHQRATLAFVERALPPDARGFGLRRELACRAEPAPFSTIFMQHVEGRYRGPQAAENIAGLISEFRSRPVSFMVRSRWLERFPEELVAFWQERFIPYREGIDVQGRLLGGRHPPGADFEVLQTGRFRWLADKGTVPSTLVINGHVELEPGEEQTLEAGFHQLALKDERAKGRLVASLPVPPGGTREFF